jgi:hypothetical protein
MKNWNRYLISSLGTNENFDVRFQNKAKGRREGNFKPIIGNESLHEASNNRVRVVNFATLKNLIVKTTTFPHCDIHKHTWTLPDGVTHYQIDHVLIDKR